MPVKVTTKVKAKKVAVQEASTLEAKIDEAAALAAEIREFEKRVGKRYAALATEIKATLEAGLPAEESQSVAGERGVATVSARPEVREIVSMEQLFKLLGRQNFLRLASVPLGKLDAYLTPEELAQVLRAERKGSRRLTITSL